MNTDIQNKIINLYKNQTSTKDIGKKLSIPRQMISSFLNKVGLLVNKRKSLWSSSEIDYIKQ